MLDVHHVDWPGQYAAENGGRDRKRTVVQNPAYCRATVIRIERHPKHVHASDHLARPNAHPCPGVKRPGWVIRKSSDDRDPMSSPGQPPRQIRRPEERLRRIVLGQDADTHRVTVLAVIAVRMVATRSARAS